jgi:hypothetical protein
MIARYLPLAGNWPCHGRVGRLRSRPGPGMKRSTSCKVPGPLPGENPSIPGCRVSVPPSGIKGERWTLQSARSPTGYLHAWLINYPNSKCVSIAENRPPCREYPRRMAHQRSAADCAVAEYQTPCRMLIHIPPDTVAEYQALCRAYRPSWGALQNINPPAGYVDHNSPLLRTFWPSVAEHHPPAGCIDCPPGHRDTTLDLVAKH